MKKILRALRYLKIQKPFMELKLDNLNQYEMF